MHRIDGPAAAPGGFFTEGDPNVGTPATVVTDTWCNAVQEEIAGVIEATGAALAKPNNHQLLQAIKALVSSALPPGAIQPFAITAAPAGWLVADGSAVSAAAYPDLAAALGTTWGAAPAGYVRLPDLRGEFLRGADLGRGADPGRAFASWQADELKAHTHGVQGYWNEDIDTQAIAAGGGSVTSTAATQSSGGFETRPRNVSVLYCIKT